ncbi:MAG: CatB-related O-acetyltransferase [Pontiellaceae bacterium]|nr:CatB-related O-acetyltransferase [Pontiellaceae bacterium]MBN2784545.1 CatB-related O-acetyltransferase [Pontiellaceae bacterium]
MANLIRSIKKRLFPRNAEKAAYVHEEPCSVDRKTKLTSASFVGRYTYIGQGTVFGDVRIGRFCSIASGFTIIYGNHPLDYLTTHPFTYNNEIFGHSEEYRNIDFKNARPAPTPTEPLIIGNDVWIGHRATLLGRVRNIGNGAVVGAGAVVTRDIPPYAVVAGNPARIIKYRFDEETIRALDALKWWDFPLSRIKHLDFSNVKACITELKIMRTEADANE